MVVERARTAMPKSANRVCEVMNLKKYAKKKNTSLQPRRSVLAMAKNMGLRIIKIRDKDTVVIFKTYFDVMWEEAETITV